MMLQMVNGARDSIRNWLEEESIQYNIVEDSQNAKAEIIQFRATRARFC